jgi:HK97 family phage prohead protease
METFTSQVRAELEGNTLSGYAAVYGQVAKLRGFYEAIEKGAFDETLKRDDQTARLGHDPSKILGRKSAGTLRLRSDDYGLAFELDLPNNTLGNDVKESVRRGDLTGCSFGFEPGQEIWTRSRDGAQLCTHKSFKRLFEVSVVANPVYEGTAVQLRMEDFDLPFISSRTRLTRAHIARLIGA